MLSKTASVLALLYGVMLLEGCGACDDRRWVFHEETWDGMLLEPENDISIKFVASGVVTEAQEHRLVLRVIGFPEFPEDDSATSEDTGGQAGLVRVVIRDGDQLLSSERVNCSDVRDHGVSWYESDTSADTAPFTRTLHLDIEHLTGGACSVGWMGHATLEGPMCCSRVCPGAPAGSTFSWHAQVADD